MEKICTEVLNALATTNSTIVDLEKGLMLEALNRTNNNQSGAARLLGITRYAFRHRMKSHGIASIAPTKKPTTTTTASGSIATAA